MPTRSDVEAPRSGMGEEELMRTVVRGAAVHERTAALKELLRRRADGVRPLVAKLLTDPGAPPDLRSTAARALGEEATAANEQALRQALAATEPSVVAAAAASLGRVGGRAAFDALARASTDRLSGAARNVTFARTLISYRLGLAEARLQEPPAAALLEADRNRAAPFRLQGVGPVDFQAARRWLDRELPGVAVADRGSARFTSGNEHLWVVLGEGMAAPGNAAVPTTDRVAAVVLKESTCPEGWYVQEYLLTHPGADGGAVVFGVRSTGKLVHFGSISGRDGQAVVHLRAVDAPGVAAMEFRADLRGGDLAVREAFCAPARGGRRNPPQAPRRAAATRQSPGG